MTITDQSMAENWRNQANDPMYKPSRAGAILRRLGAFVLNLLFLVMLLFSSFFHAANALVGTPQGAASTFLSLALAPGADTALASTACSDIAAHSPPAAAAEVNAHRATCEATVLRTMHEPKTRLLVRAAVAETYHLIESGDSGYINLDPIIANFTKALYAAIPSIPPGSLIPDSGYIIHVKTHHPINVSRSLSTTGWVLFAVGVTGAVLVARFLVRNFRSQLLSVGTTIGIPGLVTLLIGLRATGFESAVHYSDPTAKLLVSHTAQKVASVVAHNSIVLLVTDAIILILWSLVHVIWSRRNPATPTTSTVD